MKVSLIKAITQNAIKFPNKVALITKKDSFTYAQLYSQIRIVAGNLHSKGVTTGDKVVIVALSKSNYIITFLALHFLKATAIPVERTKIGNDLNTILNITGAKYYITSGKRKHENVITLNYNQIIDYESEHTFFAEDVLNDNSLDEVIFTTGTTGNPKGAMHTKEAILCSTYNTIDGIGMKEDDVILLPLPLQHSFGLRVLRATLTLGATVVLQNSSIFAQEIEKNITEHSCTGLVCVAASMEILLRDMGIEKAKKVFGKLRYIEFSAGAVSENLRRKLINMLPNVEIHNTWGSTETGGCIFINLHDSMDKIKSMGKPSESVEIALFDVEKDTILECTNDKAIGRMAIKGKMLMSGYIGQLELTKKVLINGWFVTNDLVYMDMDGYLYIVGRSDDMINSGGKKISPIEIENLVNCHDGVLESACIGVEDMHLGQVPIVYIVPTKKGEEIGSEVKKFISSKITNSKMPQNFIMIDEIPKNQMGKVERAKLKMFYKNNMDNNEVIRTMLKRRSVRDFQDKTVSDEMIEKLLIAGKSAPSGKNSSSRRFTIVRSQKERVMLRDLIREITKDDGFTTKGLDNSKVFILISNDRKIKNSIQDSACSAQNIMIASTSLGLGSVWVNSLRDICDEPAIRSKLNTYQIPQSHIVWSIIAVGWPKFDNVNNVSKDNMVYFVD